MIAAKLGRIFAQKIVYSDYCVFLPELISIEDCNFAFAFVERIVKKAIHPSLIAAW